MSEMVGIEMWPELDSLPSSQRSSLRLAARWLRLADAAETAEAKAQAQYVLLASLYQKLSERSAGNTHHIP